MRILQGDWRSIIVSEDFVDISSKKDQKSRLYARTRGIPYKLGSRYRLTAVPLFTVEKMKMDDGTTKLPTHTSHILPIKINQSINQSTNHGVNNGNHLGTTTYRTSHCVKYWINSIDSNDWIILHPCQEFERSF